MDKRKLLTEANDGQKFFFKHATVINTQPKSNHIIRNVGKSLPKIKLTSNDKSSDFRSISSPRLKSFPAEEMRRVKMNKSPRPNVFPFPAELSIPKSQSPIKKNNLNSGQGDGNHQVTVSPIALKDYNEKISQPHLSNPTYNQVQQSEVLINSNSHQWPLDQQTHRPFVPNVPHNLNKIGTPINLNNQVTESPIINNYVDVKLCNEPNIQLQNDFNNSNKVSDVLECEKQPVGGRNAAIHRLTHLSKEKPSTARNYSMPEALILNQSNKNPEFQRQYRQQMKPLEFHYDCRHAQQPNVGWTQNETIPPQDLCVDRVRSNKNNFNQHLYQQAVTKCSDAAQSQSMSPRNFGPHRSFQVKKIPDNKRRLVNSLHVRQRESQQEYPPRRLQNTQRDVKKYCQFTPAMIHDQELLVTTMRQQGINEEIMKRQFDALLNEQKRQLMYQLQLDQAEEKNEEFDNVESFRQRRISKIDEGEKPEWMVHITPPWIPYALAEEMKNPLQDGKKCVKINENFNQHHHHQQQQQQQQQQFQEYNSYRNNQNCQIFSQKLDQQCQPQLISDGGYQHENNYYQTNCNPVSSTTQQITNVGPTSILKTRNDKSPMAKLKHQTNNGLQDLESVKKAMEELKSAQNRKGFEYLSNLNKKEKYIQLNGIQNPEDSSMHNLSYQVMPEDMKQQMKRGLSANGLENTRNPNNPLPSPFRHSINCNELLSEYPKRKICNNINNYNVVPAGIENGIMMNSIINEPQQNSFEYQNSSTNGNVKYENSIQAQVCSQAKDGFAGSYNHRIPKSFVRSNSLPPNMYSEHQQTRFVDFHGISKDNWNDQLMTAGQSNVGQHYIPPNTRLQGGVHTPPPFLEARIIGGVRYLARKTEYVPHPCENSMNSRYPDCVVTYH